MKYKNCGYDYREKLWKEQEGKCAICGEPGSLRTNTGVGLVLDHDHATGKVRGLICMSCNAGLGAFKDNAISLQRANAYLTENKSMPMPVSTPKPASKIVSQRTEQPPPPPASNRNGVRLSNKAAKIFLSLLLLSSREDQANIAN